MLMSELLVATTLTYDIDVNALCTNICGNYTCMCMSAWVVWRWINLYVLVGIYVTFYSLLAFDNYACRILMSAHLECKCCICMYSWELYLRV